jgi:hypothetical protein
MFRDVKFYVLGFLQNIISNNREHSEIYPLMKGAILGAPKDLQALQEMLD